MKIRALTRVDVTVEKTILVGCTAAQELEPGHFGIQPTGGQNEIPVLADRPLQRAFKALAVGLPRIANLGALVEIIHLQVSVVVHECRQVQRDRAVGE